MQKSKRDREREMEGGRQRQLDRGQQMQNAEKERVD